MMQLVSRDVIEHLSHGRVIFQNAATHPLATYPIAQGCGHKPVRKVPSRDGYPGRSPLMV